MHHGGLSVSSHYHLLLLELLRHLRTHKMKCQWAFLIRGTDVMRARGHTYIFGRRSRDLNPGLGEEGTGAEHEHDVDDGVNGIIEN